LKHLIYATICQELILQTVGLYPVKNIPEQKNVSKTQLRFMFNRTICQRYYSRLLFQLSSPIHCAMYFSPPVHTQNT